MNVQATIDKLQDLKEHMKAQVRVFSDELKHDCETDEERADVKGHIHIVEVWIDKIESALSELNGI